MKRIVSLIFATFALTAASIAAVKAGASLPDFASIAAYIGGDRVEVFSIARSFHDPHAVEVLPSYLVQVSRADVYFKVGLGLDQWANSIIDGSRNPRLRIVDCSRDIGVLEKPSGRVDASMGDVHPEGNPHYWLDPRNGAIVARTIRDALAAADPAGKQLFDDNLQRFEQECRERLEAWRRESDAIRNRALVTYHSSWCYFADAFGFTVAAKIEPVPGIPPTGSHLVQLVKNIKEHRVLAVIQEPYFSDDAARYLNRETGVKVVKLAPSCGATDAPAYFEHLQQLLDTLKAADS